MTAIAATIPDRPKARPDRPSVALLVGLPVAFFALVLISVALARAMTGISPLWLPPALLLTALLRHHPRAWPLLMLLGGGADFAANLALGRELDDALMHGAINAFAPWLIAAGLARYADPRPWYASLSWIGRFMLLVLFASAVSATVGAGWGAVLHGTSFLRVWSEWAASNALGYVVGTLFLLSWTEPALRRSVTRWSLAEALLLALLVGLVSYLAFTTALPLLFMTFPFLALATVRCGLPGATAGLLGFVGVALWSIMAGVGPIATLSELSAFERGLILRGYFLTGLLSTLPIAIILTLRQMLTERLRHQDAISSAALDNMVQGLCMFDAERRLITHNRRYADLYPLPSGTIRSAMPLIELLQAHIAAGNHWGEPEEFVSDYLRGGDEGQREVELRDGRILDIQRAPLAEGGWVETHEDVTERRRAGHRIAYLATHDPLTDLPNRAFFNEQLQRSLALAERGHGFALHCFDLDRFKTVNDTLGHAAGDTLLTEVAARLRDMVRPSDLVSRLGGDEFAIIQFPLNSADEAGALAARIVETLSLPYALDGHEAVIGASVGIALAPLNANDAADLLQKSDLALYRAKTEGRGTFCFFEPGMDSALHRRRVMETELRAAVQKGEFELYYQPIMNLASGQITSLEALLRWRHPLRGIVEPEEFIALAEESGLIIPIGEWVIRDACREAANWPDAIKVAINLSPVQFKNRNLANLVISAVKAAGIAAERLELEITETLLLQDSEEVRATLHQLHDAGIAIAMDDFGTGYSSLSYLRSFPFDKVKIDGSFVQDVETAESLAIVHATTELSEKLGMRTTGEGVETAEQLAALRAEGCTEVQGYFISRPLPAGEVPRLLARFPRTQLRAVK